MGVIDRAIQLPVTVMVGAILIVLFGLISLFRVPVQLAPDIEKPTITVRTMWYGASPEEVEKEIIIPQEDKLKTLEGLLSMESESRDSRANITLAFEVGSDMDAALLRVANKLNLVTGYPEQAEKPTLMSASERRDPMAYVVYKNKKGFTKDVTLEKDFGENFIKPRLERIPGVGMVEFFGGRNRELQVILKPQALAFYHLTVQDVVSAIRRENKNTSAGDLEEGKRRYVLRVLGEYRTPREVASVVIKRINDIPVTVGDVAVISLGYSKETVVGRYRGDRILMFRIVQTTGANVLTVMARLKEAIKDLNENYLDQRNTEIRQVYDSTEYIEESISRVKQNIFLGGTLAVLVLLMFLGNFSSILVIGTAIPISIIGTFLMLTLFGRNVNVITLAGMSFAIGMVVDSSIVVLENIYRHYQAGKSKFEAALQGTREVIGAIVASALTTIAVFVPVVFVEEEAGQLFRDIAIAIASAVFLSLLVSLTIIPSLSSRILKGNRRSRGFNVILKKFGAHMVNLITGLVAWLLQTVWRRIMTVLILPALALVISVALIPEAEYLPTGNRNFIYGLIFPPPGYSSSHMAKIAGSVADELEPYWETEVGSPEAEKLNGPPIDNLYFFATSVSAFLGGSSKIPEKCRELIPVLRNIMSGIPGAYYVVQQGSLFARGVGQSRSIDVEITGPDLNRLIALGGEVFAKVGGLIPGAQARPVPSLDIGNPEIQVIPDREKASKVGLSASDIGLTLNVLLDGAKVDEYLYQGEEIDLVLKGEDTLIKQTQDFANIMIYTPNAGLVPLDSVCDIKFTAGPNQINHIEQQRAIVIRVIPPLEVSMERAMKLINSEIITPIEKRTDLEKVYQLRLTGTADNLSRTREALEWNFILALIITFLLMSALFENFFYPLVILFSVPMAAAGGFVGLWMVNQWIAPQPLDILTMLGFIILVGIVVNNAILIVHQSLNFMRNEGMPYLKAIAEAVRIRIRPIFMSMFTSVFGMMPLVLFPGAGSELYRGLGSVVIGGLALSSVFTLFLIPSLFAIFLSIGAIFKRSGQQQG